MSTDGPAVALLDADPGLGDGLSPHDLAAARRLRVPMRRVHRGELDLAALLTETSAFAALVLDGVVLHRVSVGGTDAMRLVGPGELMALPGAADAAPWGGRRAVAGELELALLGREVLLLARRLPQIAVGLTERMAAQNERLLAQIAICQQPRVTDRILSLLWLLADTWGRVTPLGVVLPLTLTHEMIGALVGARRPTVTLGLGELTDRGAVLKQDGSWLLSESPADWMPRRARRPAEVAQITAPAGMGAVWHATAERPPTAFDHAELLGTVARLREQHERERDAVRQRLASLERARTEVVAAREELRRAGRTATRRQGPAPS